VPIYGNPLIPDPEERKIFFPSFSRRGGREADGVVVIVALLKAMHIPVTNGSLLQHSRRVPRGNPLTPSLSRWARETR
jgi:hypothetical protein